MPRALVEPAPDAPEAFTATPPAVTPAEGSEGAAGVPVHRLARWTLALAGAAGIVWVWSVAPLLALAGLGVGLVLVGGWLVSAPWRARRQMSRRPARRARQSRPRSGGWRHQMGRAVSRRGARGGTTRVPPGRSGGSIGAPRGGARLVMPGRPGGSAGPRGGTVGAGSHARRNGLPGRRGGGQLPGSVGGSTSTTERPRSGPRSELPGLARRRAGRRSRQAGRDGTGGGGTASTGPRGASQTQTPGLRRGRFGSARRSSPGTASASPARSSIGGRPPKSGSPTGGRASAGRPTGKAGRRATTWAPAHVLGARPGGGAPGARRSSGTPGARPGATGRGAAPKGNRASTRRLRQPSTWFSGTPGARQHSRTTPRQSARARNAKAKTRREWRAWWFTPQEGATPPAPKATRQPSKPRRVDTDRPVPKGKKQRRATRPDTDPEVTERETLAWVGHSDLNTELDDGSAPGRPSPDQAPPRRGWWDSTDESAGFHTGPAANNQGVQPMSTTNTPPDVATVETARATYLQNAVAADEQAAAYASEAQTNHDHATRLAASNDTGEHDGEIGRLRQLADGCETNAALRSQQADAWTQEAATAFTRIKAMMSGG